MPQERWSPQAYPAPLGMWPISRLTWSPGLWRHPKNIHPCWLVSWVTGVVKAAGSHKQENTLCVFLISLHCPGQEAARSGKQNEFQLFSAASRKHRGPTTHRHVMGKWENSRMLETLVCSYGHAQLHSEISTLTRLIRSAKCLMRKALLSTSW